jgi:hypothetical protein
MGELDYLAGRATANARIQLLSSGITDDGTNVYLVNDPCPSVLKVSPPAFPRVVREMTRKAKLARQVLGKELGWPIPAPIDQWEIDGVSCALFDRLTPISFRRLTRFIQLRKITPKVLKWLRDVAEHDRGVNEDAENCLRALAECPYRALCEPAKEALDRVRAGSFIARSRVMHGDLWVGNTLLDPSGIHDFMVIDWRGSNVDGFPIFDLVTFAGSAALRPKILRAELAAHAARLDCEIKDTRIYLAAALGYIWLHLDQFPPERFEAMGRRCLETLENALNA